MSSIGAANIPTEVLHSTPTIEGSRVAGAQLRVLASKDRTSRPSARSFASTSSPHAFGFELVAATRLAR
jgi:hypothetical protein